jgi:hypothetical protein
MAVYTLRFFNIVSATSAHILVDPLGAIAIIGVSYIFY